MTTTSFGEVECYFCLSTCNIVRKTKEMKDLIERGKQPGKNKVKEFMILLLIIAIAIP